MTRMKPILDGGRYFEGPRWHSGRLWFVDCMDRTLLSLDASGACEQHAKFEDDTPCGLGVLPDGKLVVLTMFRKRLMTYPDGETRIVADGLRFPNGIAVSANNRRLVVAEMDGECLAEYDIEADGGLKFRNRFGNMKSPDGICLDQDEAVWVASFDEDAFIRVSRDGRELQRIDVPGRRAIACVLGGPDRRTLFCLSAVTSPEQLRQRQSSARIDVVEVEIPGAGCP